MNLDVGMLARALIARVMQLEQENAKLRAELKARDEEGTHAASLNRVTSDG